jgi:hypothetical protein
MREEYRRESVAVRSAQADRLAGVIPAAVSASMRASHARP